MHQAYKLLSCRPLSLIEGRSARCHFEISDLNQFKGFAIDDCASMERNPGWFSRFAVTEPPITDLEQVTIPPRIRNHSDHIVRICFISFRPPRDFHSGSDVALQNSHLLRSVDPACLVASRRRYGDPFPVRFRIVPDASQLRPDTRSHHTACEKPSCYHAARPLRNRAAASISRSNASCTFGAASAGALCGRPPGASGPGGTGRAFPSFG